MNNIINKFLLTADKFMLDLKVRTYSASGPFTRHKDRIYKFIKIDDTDILYKNKLDKACFLKMQHILIVKI